MQNAVLLVTSPVAIFLVAPRRRVSLTCAILPRPWPRHKEPTVFRGPLFPRIRLVGRVTFLPGCGAWRIGGRADEHAARAALSKGDDMVVIIAGSRSFSDIALVRAAVETSGWKPQIQLLISGGARGIDTLAERFAHEQGIPVEVLRADWANVGVPGAVIKRNARGLYNAAAGMQRNEAMALRATSEARSRHCAACLILIWNGTSSGSANMRSTALTYKLQLWEYIPPVVR